MLAVLHASELVTLAGPARARRHAELGELGIIRDGALLVDGGIISRVGRSAEISRLCGPDVEVLDARGGVILPGLIDGHSHFVFAGNRLEDFEARARGETYEQIAARGGGIQTTVAATRGATEDELFASARRHAEWMLRLGTTTAEAKSGYGLTTADEIKILRVIRRIGRETPLETVATFLGAHALPKEFRKDRAGFLRLVIDEMLPRVRAEELAEFCDIFCEHGYFTADEARELGAAARAAGLGLRLHVDQLSNGGGAALAAELNATTADHLEHTDDAGIRALARAQTQPVLLPGSVYALGLRRYPDARAMIAAGLAPVLATDFNPGSSPSPSLSMAMSLGVTQMKMSPAEAISAVTMNAAASLRREKTIGSLEIGKLANFIVLDASDHREIAYWFGAPLVRTVVVRGRVV